MRHPLIVVLLATLLMAPALAQDKPRLDIAIEPTTRGSVLGQVYDARTGLPLDDATVAIQQGGKFDDKGPASAKTDSMGRYRCQALLGRVSANFDVGRALMSSPIGILLGTATNKTKRVDVNQMFVRVARDGYEPFEGVVECRAVDAGRFTVTMQPVLLTPVGSAEVSTAADGWGVARIAEVTVQPAIARPGEKVIVTARILTPRLSKIDDVKLHCAYAIDRSRTEKGLKAPKAAREDGSLEFTTDFGIPRRARQQAIEVEAVLDSSPYDVSTGGERKAAIVQVVPDGTANQTTTLRAQAFQLEQNGDRAQAEARWKEVCLLPDAGEWDYRRLMRISRLMNDTSTAADAAQRILAITPPKPEAEHMAAAAVHASALVANSEAQKAIDLYSPTVQSVKERERPSRVPLPLMVAMGAAYVQLGKLDEAGKVNEELLRWKGADLYQGTIEFRNSLGLARAKQRAQNEPANVQARDSYARALMDLGRWEEAVDELRAAAETDPNAPTVQRDLGYAMLHIRGKASADPRNQDEALAAAEKQVVVPDKGKKTAKSKDFFAWHSLAMLRYARARRLEEAHDPAAASAMALSREALKEALRCGRMGADVDEGIYLGSLGYASPRLVAIAGFAYPEANGDYDLLESLRGLERNPDDYLAQYSLGRTLLELDHAELAEAPIRRTLELRPDYVEAKYALAQISLKRGERDAAVSLLREVLKANPRHPRANLALAGIYTEDGDMPSASMCLAAHAKYYGEPAR